MAADLCFLRPAGRYQHTVIAKVLLNLIFLSAIALGHGSAQHLTVVGPTVSVQQLQVPQNARRELDKSRIAYLKGNQADARKHVDRALTIAPSFANALAWRGILEWEGKQLQESCADLEKAIEYDPHLVLSYAALGTTYNKMQRWADAERVVEFGLTLDPTVWQLHYEAARTHAAQGKFDEALEYFHNADKFGPHNPDQVAALNSLKAALVEMTR